MYVLCSKGTDDIGCGLSLAGVSDCRRSACSLETEVIVVAGKRADLAVGTLFITLLIVGGLRGFSHPLSAQVSGSVNGAAIKVGVGARWHGQVEFTAKAMPASSRSGNSGSVPIEVPFPCSAVQCTVYIQSYEGNRLEVDS